MATSHTNPKVDVFLSEAPKWQAEMGLLRKLMLACGLGEELKWGKPCYTFQGANVVVILPLKSYCALLFCKGALLKDRDGFLIKAGEHTQAARQMRFTSAKEIGAKKASLKDYLLQAVEVEKAGLEVTYKKPNDFKVPEELQKKFEAMPAFKAAFTALTPGRQRGYVIFFSAAKQSATRVARIEKCTPQILKGRGLNDR
jgi:uncharacterized protein YdeI (YjbR/CyaY-like superfamily)